MFASAPSIVASRRPLMCMAAATGSDMSPVPAASRLMSMPRDRAGEL